MLETEALLLDLLQHRAMLPEFARDASYAERDELAEAGLVVTASVASPRSAFP